MRYVSTILAGCLKRSAASSRWWPIRGEEPVASAVAERFARIVYVAGMMLPSGVTFAEVQSEIDGSISSPSGVTGELSWSADGKVSTVPRAAATAILFSDCPPDMAAMAALKLTPQGEGGRALRVTTPPERFGRIPRLYVEATEDRSVLIDVQRRMQQLVPGATVISLPTGHVPQLIAPKLLAEAILPFLLKKEPRGSGDGPSQNQPTPIPDGAFR
ncbi:hypothetical protein [Breoghania sp.]|uniref:alpha/beta fold hydrolase n=1 Tax=Breoghania sp. TaxID=2065378 RepID=UPI0026354F80|nr:hypothetical protein [Breoghania sp.]MDJ0929771.1 hypothetical protein [Breoghania sp.]